MKHSILPILIMTVSCIITACDKEKGLSVNSDGEDVRIRLFVQETAVTKAQPQISEALVSDLNLFVYNSDGQLAEHLYVSNPGKELSMSISNIDTGPVYAIANAGNLADNEAVLTKTGLESLKWRLESMDGLAGRDGQIPMSGKAAYQHTGEGTINMYLTRLYSKFRLIVDTTALDKEVNTFEITEVSIHNINRSVGFFEPGGATSQDVLQIGTTAQGGELENLYTRGVDFYIPENIHGDLLNGNDSEQGHIPPEEYRDLCTYVKISVRYRSKEHYDDNLTYRFYLHDGKNLDNFDIVRNTMYTCRTVFIDSGLNDNSWRVDVSGMKDLVTDITVTPAEVTFTDKGETVKLTASVLPASAENPAVIWSSDDKNVADVAQDGTVRAIGDGNCTVTASAADGSGVSGRSRINVYADSKYLRLHDIPDILYHRYDTPYILGNDVFPSAITEYLIECLSGNRNGAILLQDRIMTYNTMHQQGEIGTYRVTAEANGMSVHDEFSLSAGYVEINKLFSNLYIGIPTKLSFNRLEPADVKLNLTAISSSMVKIQPDGSIVPQRPGKCKITATSVTGAKDSIVVNILEPYISFIDVTMFEGATWELSSGLRPVTADLAIEYSVVKGSEYVSISGNLMKGLKRTNGFNDVIIKAALKDYPQVYATAKVHVVPAVQASLTGDNRVVNTYGLTSDGSSWNFKNNLSLTVEHAPNVSMTWEVRDEDGQPSSEIQISEDGTINPYSSTANGKYYITGWDHLHRYCTDRIEIEVYRLLEYECGLGAYGSTTVAGRTVYVVTLIARWTNPSWNVILNNRYTSAMLQNKLITYPNVSTAYHSISTPPNGSPYIQNYTTTISCYSTQDVISALRPLRPLSYLRDDFSTHAGNSPGVNGKYYKFTTGQNGIDGYFYIKQRNEIFYNSNEYL